MGGPHSEHDDAAVCEVEDPATGQRYLMYPLNIAAWPTPPRLVYECPDCRGHVEPERWAGCCPQCGGRGKEKRRSKSKRRGKRR